MPTDSVTQRVALGARSYDIHIGQGLLEHAGAYLAPLLARPKLFIISDTITARRYLPTLQASLYAKNIASTHYILRPGEASKSFAQLEKVCHFLLKYNAQRSDYVVALGGGVIGDVTGLACALLKRGCQYVQIPTTLLAQIDSSIGGKTAINTTHGKNLIGTFYQPKLVVIDTHVLRSLPKRQMLAGYAEMVKYAVLGNEKFFQWLERHGAELLAHDPKALQQGITTCCKMKARLVARDEREGGARALLNLGHTFGHALEATTGYGQALLHGEAVALGMQLACEFSVAQKLCPASDAARLCAHLAQVGLPHQLHKLPRPPRTDSLLKAMMQDKKMSGSTLTLVLLHALGNAFVQKQINPSVVRKFLQQCRRKG